MTLHYWQQTGIPRSNCKPASWNAKRDVDCSSRKVLAYPSWEMNIHDPQNFHLLKNDSSTNSQSPMTIKTCNIPSTSTSDLGLPTKREMKPRPATSSKQQKSLCSLYLALHKAYSVMSQRKAYSVMSQRQAWRAQPPAVAAREVSEQ
jgi:hypothetical protein